MSNVMMLYDKPSLLHTSMVNMLKENGHSVFEAEMEMRCITKCSFEPSIIFMYADENLEDNISALVYLKDYAIEHDIPIFYAGDEEQTKIIEKYIPKTILKDKYLRPINVKQIVADIHRYLLINNRESMKKILVVDDSGAMLRNVKGWLEDKYKVIPVNSATMAIKYLATDIPDLILLDYEMPVIDGKQALEMIRSENEFSRIPVIFLTNKGDRESVMQVMSLKPQGYLLKSMPPEEIKKSIDDFFQKQKYEKLG